MNNSAAQPRDAAPSQSSIVAHPWFPKMIGLWFAALFGLCSLAMAPELLERIVTTLGIDRIVPAAAPPLGQTTRLLLALGMAGVGEIAGLVIGARLAARPVAQLVRQRGITPAASEADGTADAPHLRGRDRHPDAPARKPLSATSDLGDDFGRIDTALRRRALASETDHEPRSFFEVAPLPGDDWQPTVENAGEAEQPAATATAPAIALDDSAEVFDLAAFHAPPLEPTEVQAAPFAAPFLAPPAPVVEPIPAPEPGAPPVAEVAPVAEAPAPAVEIATASLDALGVVQLSERLALALQARRERRFQPPVVDLPVAPSIIAAVEESARHEPVAIAPIEDLPLAEPLAAQEDTAAPAAPAPMFAPQRFTAPALFAPVAEVDADEDDEIPALARSLALPRLTGSGSARPARAPEPVAPELERGLEILARRAPRAIVEPDAFIAAAEPSEAGHDAVGDELESEELSDETLDEGYSSLLAMGSSFQRPEAVRIEEPQSDEIEPVVIFPGQGARAVGEAPNPFGASLNAPFARPGGVAHAAEPPTASDSVNSADPEETDRALRAALASLQRISGAR